MAARRAIPVLEERIFKLPGLARWTLGLLAVFMVSLVDYLTGYEVAFYVFYLIPVAYFAWFTGRRNGILISAICAVTAEVTDLSTGFRYSSAVYIAWSILVKMGVFMVAVIALDIIRHEMVRQKKDNEKMLRAYQEIQRVAQIKSEFTAMVSHELRTPLTAIRESVNVVSEGCTGSINADQKKYLEMTVRNVDRLSRLINDVLEFAKLDNGRRKAAVSLNDLNALVLETVDFFRPAASAKGLSLNAEIKPGIPPFLFDRDAVEEVLANAINNALKFTESGSVSLDVRRREGEVLVSVRDTGCGVLKEDIPALFSPFVQFGKKYGKVFEGTGLGLAISRMLMDQCGGRIWLESEFGKGTTLNFTLPLKLKE